MRDDCIRSEAVHETLPVPGEDLVQRALAAAQVFVERRKVGPQARTRACGPHEQPQGAFKVLAKNFL